MDAWAQERIIETMSHISETCLEIKAAAYEKQRPFVLLRPGVFIDGNQWCALYGDNLQDGVAGFGDSPELAARNFDREWCKKLPARAALAKEVKP